MLCRLSFPYILNSYSISQPVGDLNTTEEIKDPQQQPEETNSDPKVESEDEGTGQDLPESCENSGDEEPVTNEQVAEELIEVQESETVVEEQKEVNDIGSGEEVQDLENEESLDKEVIEKVDESLQEEEEADHDKENHINGTAVEQNNHFEAEEQLTKEEEENNKNKEQESGDIVDFKKNLSKQEESQQSISELKSKWDSFGKEQSNSPTDHSHRNEGDNMADTTKTSRFVSTCLYFPLYSLVFYYHKPLSCYHLLPSSCFYPIWSPKSCHFLSRCNSTFTLLPLPLHYIPHITSSVSCARSLMLPHSLHHTSLICKTHQFCHPHALINTNPEVFHLYCLDSLSMLSPPHTHALPCSTCLEQGCHNNALSWTFLNFIALVAMHQRSADALHQIYTRDSCSKLF